MFGKKYWTTNELEKDAKLKKNRKVKEIEGKTKKKDHEREIEYS